MAIFSDDGTFTVLQPQVSEAPEQPEASSQFETYTSDVVPYANENVPPSWEWKPMERMEKSVKESIGSLIGASSAIAKTIGADRASEYLAEKSGQVFQSAVNEKLVETNFSEIDSPLDAAKYAVELITGFVPDLLMMAVGGVGAGALAGRTATRVFPKATEAMLAKGFKKNLDNVVTDTAFKGATKDVVYKEAIRRTARDAGALVGVSGFEGAQGAGQAFLQDREINGLDADPWKALAVGGAQSAISMLNPLNKVIAMGIPKGSTASILKMTAGEAAEEMGQEIPAMMHEAGLDPNKTFEEILKSPEGAMRLLESGVAGALLGTTFGGGVKLATGGFSKQAKTKEMIDKTVLNPQETLKGTGISTEGDVVDPNFTENSPAIDLPEGIAAPTTTVGAPLPAEPTEYEKIGMTMAQKQADRKAREAAEAERIAEEQRIKDTYGAPATFQPKAPKLPTTEEEIQSEKDAENLRWTARRKEIATEIAQKRNEEFKNAKSPEDPKWKSDREYMRKQNAAAAIEAEFPTIPKNIEAKAQRDAEAAKKAEAELKKAEAKQKKAKTLAQKNTAKKAVAKAKSTVDAIDLAARKSAAQAEQKAKRVAEVEREVKMLEGLSKQDIAAEMEMTPTEALAENEVDTQRAEQLQETNTKEQQAILASMVPAEKRKGWQGFKQKDGELKAYSKEDGIIIQNKSLQDTTSRRAWGLSINRDGKLTKRGFFKTFDDANDAHSKGLTAREYYKEEEAAKKTKKTERAATPLTPEQTQLIVDADTNKITKKALGYTKIDDDQGVVAEAIIDAAKTYDPKKQKKQSFEQYAISRAVFAIRDNLKTDESVNWDSIDAELSEGGGTKAEMTSKKEVTEAVAPKEKVKKSRLKKADREVAKKKEEPKKAPEVKKVELSEKEKANLVKRHQERMEAQKKQKELANLTKIEQEKKKQKAKEADNLIKAEAKIKKEGKKVTESRLKREAGKMSLDQSFQDLKDSTEALSKKVSEDQKSLEVQLKETTEESNPEDKMSRLLLQKHMHNPIEALEDAKTVDINPKFEHLREKVVDILQKKLDDFVKEREEFNAKYKNALDVLEVAAKSELPIPRQLAKYLLDTVDWMKLQDIKVEKSWENARHGDGRVTLINDKSPGTIIHEIVHAITIKEMETNKELRDKVDTLMRIAEREAVKRGYVSQTALNSIKKLKNSYDFIKSDHAKKNRNSYGFLNRNEFLSEAFSNVEFRNFLKSVKFQRKSKTSVWEKLMKYVGNIFKMDAKTVSLLEAVYEMVPTIANYGVEPSVEAVSPSMSLGDKESIPLYRGEARGVTSPKAKTHPGIFFFDKRGMKNAAAYSKGMSGKEEGSLNRVEVPKEVVLNLIDLNSDKITEHLFGYTSSISSRGAMPTEEVVDKIRELGKSGYKVKRPSGLVEYFILPEHVEGIPYSVMEDTIKGRVSPALSITETNIEEERRPKKSREDQIEIMLANDTREKPVDALKEWSKKAKDLFKDLGQSVTERLRRIDYRLMNPLRRMEFDISSDNKKYQEMIRDFVDGYNKLSKEDKVMLDLTLMNREEADIKTRNEILKRNGLTKAYGKVEDVLKQIHRNKDMVGLNNYKDLADYFPRRVKDVRALMRTIKEDPTYNVIQAELDKLGKDASQADKEKALQTMINTGRFPALALLEPSSSKRRTIRRVSSSWKHHYANSTEALINHIYESNEAIHARKLFGDVHRKKLVQERDKLYKDLEELSSTSIETRKKKVGKILQIEQKLEDFEGEFTEGISQLLTKIAPDLNTEQADEVIRLIRGRLTQKGMHGPLSSLRNISLMSALSSPTSAITQIGDLAFSIYKYGPVATVRAMLGDKLIKPSDLDLTGSMKEFQSEGTAKWLDKTLKWSGLQTADIFFKSTTMQAALNAAKKLSLTQFKEKYGDYYGDQTEAMYKDIVEGENTELSRFFAFNELSDLQPVSMSEMPLNYLTAGNGRILYALKSYNIKALNNIYRESVGKWKNAKTVGEKAKAAKDAGRLILLMTLAGATADELKDFLLGKDAGTFSDNVMNNLLKIGMMSRYTLDQGFSKGFAETFLKDVLLPPTGLIDDPLTDIAKLLKGEPDFKTLNNAPWGKVAYNWFIPAAETKDMGNLKKQITEQYADGKSLSSIRSDMNKYNAWARKNKENIISLGTLTRARKEAMKK